MSRPRIDRALPRAFGCLAGLAVIFFTACGDRGRQNAKPSASQKAPENAAELGAFQYADRDLLGELELGRTDDPTFESVASYLPGLKKPREAVGVKHHPHDIGVAPDAALELSDDASVPGNPRAYFEVGEPAVRFGAAPAGCRKSLVEGVPVVTAVFEHEGVRYRQTVFGYSEGLSAETPLWAMVEFGATATDPGVRRIKVGLHIGPGSAAAIVRTWDLALSPGVPAAIRLKIPFDGPERGWAEIDGSEFETKTREVLDFWRSDLRSGTALRTPEARVNEARGAWLAFASLDVDKRGGVLEPHDGAGFYEQVYGYSAALYAHALDLWGRPEEAREILDSLLTLQAPDGVFTSHFGTPDTGALLFAMCEHFTLTADAAWLKRVAPNMVRMAAWVAAKRRESMTPEGAPRTVTYGLIKFRPYADSLAPAYDYFGDTYCAAGLGRTARALAAVGLAEDAARIALEAKAYRRDILISMDMAAFESGGLKVLPLEPETRRILKDSKGRASDYYSLIASCMLESEFLPAADERAGWVMRFMEEKGGLRLGMCAARGPGEPVHGQGAEALDGVVDDGRGIPPGTASFDPVEAMDEIGRGRFELFHPPLDIDGLGIVPLLLQPGVEDAEVRRRVAARRGHPLPVAVVDAGVVVLELRGEVPLPFPPVDAQVLDQEGRADHADAVVHETGRVELAHAGVDDGEAGRPLPPAPEPARVVAPSQPLVLGVKRMAEHAVEVKGDVGEEVPPVELAKDRVPGTEPLRDGLVELPDGNRAELGVRREPGRSVDGGEVSRPRVVFEAAHPGQETKGLGPAAGPEKPVVPPRQDPGQDRRPRFGVDLADMIVGRGVLPRRGHGEGAGGAEERREHRVGRPVGFGDGLRFVEKGIAGAHERGVLLAAGVLDGRVPAAAERRVVPVEIDRVEALGPEEGGDDLLRPALKEKEARAAGPELPVETGQRGGHELKGGVAPVGVSARLPGIEDEGGDDLAGLPESPDESGVVLQAKVPAKDEERSPHLGASAGPRAPFFGNQGKKTGVLAL